MDLLKLHIDEIRGFEGARIRQVEDDIRRQMLDSRMNMNTVDGKATQKVKQLRKSLARLKTVQSEQRRKQQLASKESK